MRRIKRPCCGANYASTLYGTRVASSHYNNFGIIVLCVGLRPVCLLTGQHSCILLNRELGGPQTCSGADLTSSQWVPVSLPEAKATGVWCWPLTSIYAEIMYHGAITLLPLYAFTPWASTILQFLISQVSFHSYVKHSTDPWSVTKWSHLIFQLNIAFLPHDFSKLFVTHMALHTINFKNGIAQQQKRAFCRSGDKGRCNPEDIPQREILPFSVTFFLARSFMHV